MIVVGDIVWANQFGLGLPYDARVEEIRNGKAKIRPLGWAFTQGSARAGYANNHANQGKSQRARWVDLASISKKED